MEMVTKNAEETAEFGKRIADYIRVKGKRYTVNGAKILALVGDLGSGKTTFTQGFARGLGISQRIISPTFIIMRQYRLMVKGKRLKVKDFYHVDLYRLEENIGDELVNLGLMDAWGDPENIIVIEWAEKARGFLPDDTIWVSFENMGEDGRRIKITGSTDFK